MPLSVKKSVSTWHWSTKIVILFGFICIVYFLIFDSYGATNKTSISRDIMFSREELEYSSHSVDRDAALLPRKLPRLEQFNAMIDRPLFSPLRRRVRVDMAIETNALNDPPAFPLINFVGTIEEGSRIRALTDGPSGLRHFSAGEEIDGWQILSVERRRIILALGDEQLELEIFGALQ